MKRFNSFIPVPARRILVGAVITAAAIGLGVTTAVAAAPGVSQISTTTITTNGRTALTYTGYMNGESFQQDAILTYRGWQYTTFWDQSGYVNVSRRALPSGSWQNVQLTDYRTSSTDSHNVISMGVSAADGTLHLSYDMHATQLRYRRSVTGLLNNPGSATWAASSFGANQNGLTGSPLNTVTYPQFISTPAGALQLALRTGASGTGNEVLYEYTGGTWRSLGTFMDGVSTSQNAYLFGIEYDSTGLLHVTWTVRETPNASTNHDLFYAYSKDNGRTWRGNAGSVVATTGSNPIAVNSATMRVWTIGQNRGLMNAESQVVDAAGVVHVLASHLPAAAPSQSDFTAARENVVLVHYYREKATKIWRQTYTPYKERSSRGDIAVDSRDNLYVVSGDSSTRRLSIHTASKASTWTDWTTRYTSSAIYFSDPLIDHARLRTDNVLSFFTPQYGGSRIDIQDWRTAP